MAYIEWSDRLSVKIKSIDEQHKKLVQIINDLDESISKGVTKKELCELLGGLSRYTIKHFSLEEELFDQYEFRDSQHHKASHKGFVSQLKTMIDKYYGDDIVEMDSDILSFLKSWLINHIMVSDMKYATYLNSKGVS